MIFGHVSIDLKNLFGLRPCGLRMRDVKELYIRLRMRMLWVIKRGKLFKKLKISKLNYICGIKMFLGIFIKL